MKRVTLTLALAFLALLAVATACTVDLHFNPSDPVPDAAFIPPDAGEPDANGPHAADVAPDAAGVDAQPDSGIVADAQPSIDS